jgi:hypothetical protein
MMMTSLNVGKAVTTTTPARGSATTRRVVRHRMCARRMSMTSGEDASSEDAETTSALRRAAARSAVIDTVAPRDVMDSISVPAELVQVRAYVRWEEAGMPSDTTPEWQQNEYDEALLDLKIELLSGKTINEIRARYKMEPVEGGDEAIYSADADLARRIEAAEALVRETSLDEDEEARTRDEAVAFVEDVVVSAPDSGVEEEEPEVVAEVQSPEAQSPVDAEDSVIVPSDMDTIIDVFATLSEEEIADMEKSFSQTSTWSTHDQLVAAIRTGPSEEEVETNIRQELAETKLALENTLAELEQTKADLEDVEAEIVVSQAEGDKALAEMKEGWAAEVSSLEAQLKQANALTGSNGSETAKELEAALAKSETLEQQLASLQAENAETKKKLEESQIAQIKAEAVRDANSEVVLMLKRELESVKEELREAKSNSVSESEYAAMKSELDRAWEAAAELQSMWDNDRKVIEFLTKSIDDEKAKKQARMALDIPAAAKGLLGWARNTIASRAADVTAASASTINSVSQAYQDLEASTGDFSDDVVTDDPSESDYMPRM